METNDMRHSDGPFAEYFPRLQAYVKSRFKLHSDEAGRLVMEYLAEVNANATARKQALADPQKTRKLLEVGVYYFIDARCRLGESVGESVSDRFDFPPTRGTSHWNELISDDPDIRVEALDELLRAYLPPMKAYLTACFKNRYHLSDEWIEDCLQEFVFVKILQKDLLGKYDKFKGRFRDFLKKSLYNFALDQIRRDWPDLIPPGSEDGGEDEGPPYGPEDPEAGDSDWAMTTIVRVLRHMRDECERKAQANLWTVFVRRRLVPLTLFGEVERLDETVKWICILFNSRASIDKISEWQITADRKFRRCLDIVLAKYCRDLDEIEDERKKLMEIVFNIRWDKDQITPLLEFVQDGFQNDYQVFLLTRTLQAA